MTAGEQEAALPRTHQRMQERLQPGQGVGIGEDLRGERAAIDPRSRAAVASDAWEGRAHRGHPCPARPEQTVDHRVGVVDRRASRPEGAGHGGLAHADRAGKAEHDHLHSPSATKARSASVAAAGAPNHAVKPGRAW